MAKTKSGITRRDLLHGSSVAAAGVLAAAGAAAASDTHLHTPPVYPPGQSGLRGSHPGSFEVAHEVGRENRADWGVGAPDPDSYDLVVVGAGISGLSAAYFYQQAHPRAKILILDNHDDFGGHAKRNEYVVDGETLLGYGGSQSLEAPGSYSEVSKRLLRDLGVDVDMFHDAYDHSFFQQHNLSTGVLCDAKTFGEQRFVHFDGLYNTSFIDFAKGPLSQPESIARMPLSERGRSDLTRLLLGSGDKLPDVGLTQLSEYLGSISYQTFLTRHLDVQAPEVIKLLQNIPNGYFGLGIDGLSAFNGLLFGLPGLAHVGVLGARALRKLLITATVEPYIFHFPDGNATIARKLVHALIPNVAVSALDENLVNTLFDYAQLDRGRQAVRLRLNSTVVNVTNSTRGVQVKYVKDGHTYVSSAKQCVLACYNRMIPHLMPELPTQQKAALASSVKVPLVYSNVVLKNWRALAAKGVGMALTPGHFHNYMLVDFPVSVPGYDFAKSPDDPIVLHHSLALGEPGLAPRDQFRIGRQRLLTTPYADIESDLIAQLDGILSGTDFEPMRDIAAITVNRWPHGYTYGHYPLFDPAYEPGAWPHEIGRVQAGNVTIANADAGGRAYLDAAVDEAYRAVQELG